MPISAKTLEIFVKMIQDDIKASKLDQRHLDGLLGSQSRNQNMWDLSKISGYNLNLFKRGAKYWYSQELLVLGSHTLINASAILSLDNVMLDINPKVGFKTKITPEYSSNDHKVNLSIKSSCDFILRSLRNFAFKPVFSYEIQADITIMLPSRFTVLSNVQLQTSNNEIFSDFVLLAHLQRLESLDSEQLRDLERIRQSFTGISFNQIRCESRSSVIRPISQDHEEPQELSKEVIDELSSVF